MNEKNAKFKAEQFLSWLKQSNSTESSKNDAVKESKAVEKTNSLNSFQYDCDREEESVNQAPNIPNTLDRKCFYGLAGEIVKTFEPHSEADPMALLLNTLVAFGNVIGRTAFFEVEGAKHYTNLYSVLVGTTSAGKGSSWTQTRRLFELVEEEWSRNQTRGGLSSGEGLISAVSDNDIQRDKRLLVVETEFSSVLSMNKREGNTLSPIIRGFWDEGSAQTMTKNNPISVNDAHISIIGHITPDELSVRLNQTEINNGFVNRFLWLQVRDSKDLPEGGKPSDEELNALVGKLSEAIKFARTVEEIERDEKARLLWINKYPKLKAERGGAFGNATARARAQVVRLSIIYALMDKSNVIRQAHLEAALDFWSYCENSARQIFGESTGNKLADDILESLRNEENGLSKTEIIRLTGNNGKAHHINSALQLLANCNLASCRKASSPDSKKPIEIWLANEFNEFNDSNKPVKDRNQSNNGNVGLNP